MRRTDPLIVGGGPAGAATAIMLARAGARPLVLERSREPREIVCGAFLGWDALAALDALGIDAWALGARAIDRVRIVAGARRIERRLPRRAAGLSRRTLDAALLARAADVGTAIERGVTVRRIAPDGLHLNDGGAIEPTALFLATGKHVVRGAPRVGADGRHVGLRATLPEARDLAGCIELHLFREGYAGLLLQEDGCSNICLSVTADRLGEAGSPAALLEILVRENPMLGARLGGAALEWAAIAGVPYGWRCDTTRPGLFRVGDQAAVIASLAGDGIAIALASGRAAARAWLDGGDAAADRFQRAFTTRARRPIEVAESLRRVAERPRLAAPLLGGPARVPGALRLAALLTRIGT